jgi:hypothetical protein
LSSSLEWPLWNPSSMVDNSSVCGEMIQVARSGVADQVAQVTILRDAG